MIVIIGAAKNGMAATVSHLMTGSLGFIGIIPKESIRFVDVIPETEAEKMKPLVSFNEVRQCRVFVAIGDSRRREYWYQRAKEQLNTFLTVQEVEVVNYSNITGEMCYLGSGTVIHNDCKIGNGVYIGINSVIEHNCEIKDFVTIAPSVTVCGRVEVGERTFIGAGATIIPDIKIGRDCIIGAGTVVIRNVEDGKKLVGVPGREIE